MEDKYNKPYAYERLSSSEYNGMFDSTLYVKYPIGSNELLNSSVPPRGNIALNISTVDMDDIRREIMMKNFYENINPLLADDNKFNPSIKYLKDINTNKIYKITIEEANLEDLNIELEAIGFKQF